MYILFLFLVAVFILIGSIIFGVRVNSIPSTVVLAEYLYVPYGFNIVGGALCSVAGMCMLAYKSKFSYWLPPILCGDIFNTRYWEVKRFPCMHCYINRYTRCVWRLISVHLNMLLVKIKDQWRYVKLSRVISHFDRRWRIIQVRIHALYCNNNDSWMRLHWLSRQLV